MLKLKIVNSHKYRSPTYATRHLYEKTIALNQNMLLNPTTRKIYLYFIYKKSLYTTYICNYIYENHGTFPRIILNSEDKLIFDIDCKYELIYPKTEHDMRRLIEAVNHNMIYNNIYSDKYYRYIIYVNEQLKYYYTNIFGEYWRANLEVIQLN